MVLNSIVYFLSLTVSFFLFFFNVPYWTGRDMADMSKSGIWRAFFRFLSFLGYGLYIVYVCIVRWIVGTLQGRRTGRIWSGIAGLVDVLCSAGVLFLLVSAYSGIMDNLFPAEVDALAEETADGLLGKISKALVFFRVVRGLDFGSGIEAVVAAVIVTLIAVALYVVINTLFFSVLFGFLRELLQEKAFWKRTQEMLNISSAPALKQTENPAAPKSLLRQLREATEDFFNKTTLHNFVYEPLSLILFLLVMLIYSVIMVCLGKNDLGPLDVVKRVLDSIGVVQIIASFIVTYFTGKLAERTAKSVVKVLPQGLQNAIHAASAKGNIWADKQDAERHGWSQRHQPNKRHKPSTVWHEPDTSDTPDTPDTPEIRQEPEIPVTRREPEIPVTRREPEIPVTRQEPEQPQKDPIQEAVDFVRECLRHAQERSQAGARTRDTISKEEVLALFDSGAVSRLTGPGSQEWGALKTDEERGAYIKAYAWALVSIITEE